MAISDNSVRINVTMGKDLAQWVESKSKELGITKSALIAVATGQYRTQVIMTDLVSRIPPSELQKIMDKMSEE